MKLYLRLFVFLASLLSAPLAQAQSKFGLLLGAALSGNPVGAGFTFNSPLFAPTSASLQFSGPFTVSGWANMSSYNSAVQNYFLNAGFSVNGTFPASGFEVGFNGQFQTVDPFGFVLGNSGSNCNTSYGRTCTRASWVNDGAWHHVCGIWDGTSATNLYIDGVVRDQALFAGTYVATANYWQLGSQSGVSLRDVRVYTRALAASDCNLLYQYGQHNLIPASGPLTTGMAAYWPMTTASCAGGSCTDSSGNGNTLVPDTTPPSVSILTPSPGTLSGTVSLTASCSDAIACSSVLWQIDTVSVAAPVTTSPYSFSWNSATFVDGSHTLSAVATNAAGVTNTASISITTSNGISAKTVFIDPSGGSDSNNCLSSGAACQTITKANSFTYLGGDTLAFKAGSTNSIASSAGRLLLLGPNNSGLGTQNAYAGGPTAPITVTTYNGGTCLVIAGTLTGCATMSQTGAMTTGTGIVEVHNVSNFVVNNLVTNSNGDASALCFECVYGFLYQNNGSNVGSGVTINNVKAIDFAIDIGVLSTSGSLANMSVTNNFATGSSSTVTIDAGIYIAGVNGGSGLVQGNLVTNIGARTTGSFPGGTGNGIILTNESGHIVDQFNVVHNFGANNIVCGGPAGNWTFIGLTNTIQFNESYNGAPTSFTTGCDWDGFDLDGGTSNSIMQYNYSHNNYGGGFTHFITSESGGFAWQKNTTRYNISENDGINGSSGSYTLGASNLTNTQSAAYNNVCYTHNAGAVGNASVAWCWSIDVNTDFIIANNISINDTGNYMVNSFNATSPTLTTFRNNNYYQTSSGSSSPLFRWGATNYSTIGALQTATGNETGSVSVNPQITSPGGGGTCYSSGVPAGPQPCPSAYVLQAGSPMIGTGLDLTSLLNARGLPLPTRDYYGNSVPNGVGTGYNIGADGAHH